MTISAVLDACVLVPAPLRDLLLRSARSRLYRAVWSEQILVEVGHTLVARSFSTHAQSERLIQTLRREFPNAIVPDIAYNHLIATMTNHPKDRHVLAAAVAAPAGVIVTHNLRDFSTAALEPHHIAVQSPDEFLMSLWQEDSSRLVQIVRQQAVALRRPQHTIYQVLDNLSLHAPTFAALVREQLASDQEG